MNIDISTTLYCSANANIELPINDWSEIKEWYIKWDTFHYTLDGENWLEEGLNSDSLNGIDWKRPTAVWITDENDKTLAETE